MAIQMIFASLLMGFAYLLKGGLWAPTKDELKAHPEDKRKYLNDIGTCTMGYIIAYAAGHPFDFTTLWVVFAWWVMEKPGVGHYMGHVISGKEPDTSPEYWQQSVLFRERIGMSINKLSTVPYIGWIAKYIRWMPSFMIFISWDISGRPYVSASVRGCIWALLVLPLCVYDISYATALWAAVALPLGCYIGKIIPWGKNKWRNIEAVTGMILGPLVFLN